MTLHTFNHNNTTYVKIIPSKKLFNSTMIHEVLEATKDGINVIVVVKIRKSKDEAYDDAQEIVSLELPQ